MARAMQEGCQFCVADAATQITEKGSQQAREMACVVHEFLA